MAKYIDADLLRKEIEKHIKEVKAAVERFTLNMGFFDAKLSGIYDVMAIIDSLQQEQPEVDLEKVVMIDNVIMNMTAEGYNNGYKTRPFYEEVLRRFNENRK